MEIIYDPPPFVLHKEVVTTTFHGQLPYSIILLVKQIQVNYLSYSNHHLKVCIQFHTSSSQKAYEIDTGVLFLFFVCLFFNS